MGTPKSIKNESEVDGSFDISDRQSILGGFMIQHSLGNNNADVERLKKQLEQEVDKRKELFSATQSNKFQIGELETKCSELENENETLKKSIQSLDEQIRSLQFLLSSKTSENSNLRDEIKKVEERKQRLEVTNLCTFHTITSTGRNF